MKQRIIDHSKAMYSSKPKIWTDKELDIIINDDCKCWHCGESVFDLEDFPDIREGHVVCEDCSTDEYRICCPLCENYYEKEDMTEYFFISKENSSIVRKRMGVYKILSHPFFWGNIVTGFEGFFHDAIKRVSGIDIEEAFRIQGFCEEKIPMDCFCSECAETYLRSDNFIKSERPPITLIKPLLASNSNINTMSCVPYREKARKARQSLVIRRIYFRGLLEKYNSKHK